MRNLYEIAKELVGVWQREPESFAEFSAARNLLRELANRVGQIDEQLDEFMQGVQRDSASLNAETQKLADAFCALQKSGHPENGGKLGHYTSFRPAPKTSCAIDDNMQRLANDIAIIATM